MLIAVFIPEMVILFKYVLIIIIIIIIIIIKKIASDLLAEMKAFNSQFYPHGHVCNTELADFCIKFLYINTRHSKKASFLKKVLVCLYTQLYDTFLTKTLFSARVEHTKKSEIIFRHVLDDGIL